MSSQTSFLFGKFSAAALAACPAGGCVISTGNGDWVPYAGNSSTYPGGQIGMFLAATQPGASNPIQVSGFIDPSIFNLGAGTAGTIGPGVVPSRGATPAIGTCDANGSIIISPSYAGTGAILPNQGAGGGGGSTIAAPFTMPAVGSTVGVSVASGTPFAKGYAVTLTIAGVSTFMQLTTDPAGNAFTLLNSGGPNNLTPGLTVAAGTSITVASTNAPLAAVAPSAGQSLMLGLNGLYNPVGQRECVNARRFGLVGDGVTDNSPFLQASVNYMALHGGVLYVPPGIAGNRYLMLSTVTIDLTASTFSGFIMKGDYGTNPQGCASFQWNGPLGAVLGGNGGAGECMFLLKGGTNFKCEDLDFYAGYKASTTWQIYSANGVSNIGCHWTRCGFVGCQNFDYWLPAHTYALNDIIVGPSNDSWVTSGNASNNGYAYQCTTAAGVPTSATPGVVFTKTLNVGSNITDSVGNVWTQIGRSGAGFICGMEQTEGGGFEVSEVRWTECYFIGAQFRANDVSDSGLRILGSSNTKNFAVDHCSTNTCGRGIDAEVDGAMLIEFCIFANSGETDVYQGSGGTLTMIGCESEGSARLLEGGGTATITGTSFSGTAGDPTLTFPRYSGPRQYPSGHFPCIVYSGQLALIANQFDYASGVSAEPIEIMMFGSLIGSAIGQSGLTSVGNYYINTTQLGAIDPNGGTICRTTGNSSQAYAAGSVSVASLNDCGNTGLLGSGGQPCKFQNILGGNFAYTNEQWPQNTSRNEISSAAIPGYAKSTGSCQKVTVTWQDPAFLAAATSGTVRLGAPLAGMRIKQVVADVTIAFQGVAGATTEVGKISPLNTGTATSNAYLLAADITTTARSLNMGAVRAAAATPQAVTVSGTPAIASIFELSISLTGGRGTATFSWKLNDVPQGTLTTAASVALGSTGVTANFPVGTYTNTDQYITSTSLSPYGILDSDQGASLARATAVCGGDLVWGPPLTGSFSNNNAAQFNMTATFRGGGNLGTGAATHFTSGSVDFYIFFERASFYLGGQTVIG